MKFPRYAVLFRTHIWDAYVEEMALQVSKRVETGDFFVLADETNQILDPKPYTKISHNVDFSDLGLDIEFPGKSNFLWYNGDFPLYRALVSLPDYDYYCMIEYDVVFNHPFDTLIDTLVSDGTEMVGFRLGSAPDNIAEHVRPYFQNTNSLLPPVLIASRRAAEYLFQTRRRIAEIYRMHPEHGWPFCEGFMGAAISDRPDIRYKNLGDFGDVHRYEHFPPYVYSPDMISEVPSFIHPALDPARFIRSHLRRPGAEFFDPTKSLRRDLEQVPPTVFVPILQKQLEDQHDRTSLLRLREYLRTNGFYGLFRPVNVALGCSATQSSISPWSGDRTIEQEAERALHGPLYGPPNFHVGPEENPWWGVDLQCDFEIDSIFIYNRSDRLDLANKFRYFSIFSSFDGVTWTLQYKKTDDEAVGGDAVRPFVVTIEPPFIGRYIRIQDNAHSVLHLTRIEIYGWLPGEARLS